jgi:uncharacterized Ntn-hydrolase superfamily protein
VRTASGIFWKSGCLLLLLACFMPASAGQDPPARTEIPRSLFAILARDSATGDFGAAFVSGSLNPDPAFLAARAEAGIIMTVGETVAPSLWSGLDLLSQGKSARQVTDSIAGPFVHGSFRQIAVLDHSGMAYAGMGDNRLLYSGALPGYGYCIIGSGILNDSTLIRAARAYENSGADFPDRLLQALQSAGGANALRMTGLSAGLIVVRDEATASSDRLIDFHVNGDTLAYDSLSRLYSASRLAVSETRMKSVDLFIQKKLYTTAQYETRQVVTGLNLVLREKPDDPDVLSRIAHLLIYYQIDGARALELARRATGLAPATPAYRDVEAECHYGLGQMKEAAAIEEELMKTDPSNSKHRILRDKYLGGQPQKP